ncbi:MAG TPA: hypothetical protein VJ824_06660 [Bacillota bacterium]|nr:hypothetical protein [Bacillota bacterium]
MSERNILAGFVSIDDAQEAQKALKNAGFNITQIDTISPYPGEGIQEVMNPITGNIPSLPSMVLDADFDSKSASILAATDVSASGMSDGDGMMPEVNQGVLLTAVVPADQADQAEQIVKQYGGNV